MANKRDNLRETLHWVTTGDATPPQLALGLSLAVMHVPTWLRQGNVEKGRIWLTWVLSAVSRLAPDDAAGMREQIDSLRIARGLLSALQGDPEMCRQTLAHYPPSVLDAADISGRRRLVALARIALEVDDLSAAMAYLEPIISHSGDLNDPAMLRRRQDLSGSRG